MRFLRAASGALATVVLCAAAPPPSDTTTFVQTTATAAVRFPPDRLFIAIDVEAETDAPNTVGNADLDAAVKRLAQHGIAATSVVKRYVTTPEARWRRVTTDLDPRPYGIVLIALARPAPGELVTLTEQTLAAAFEKPLSDGTFAEVGGAWYGLDDCRRLRVAARKGALALARERGEHLAQAAGFTLDASGGVRAAESGVDDSPDESDRSYVCGRSAFPDVPPPQIREPVPEAARSGFAEEESTITVGWPTLPLGAPRPITLPKDLTSLGTDDDPADPSSGPLQPGTLRASGSVSSADVSGGSGCPYDRALSGALALALERAAIAGRGVGLVPDHPLTIVDETEYRSPCPAHGPAEAAATARIGETFAAAGQPSRFRAPAHLEASGTAELRVPADRARFIATLKSNADWETTVRALSSAGADPATLHALAGATPTIEGFVPHPTAATMQALDGAFASLSVPGTTPARAFAYAVDDCSALNERVLRGATESARDAARAEAQRRGVRLRTVTAVEAGPVRIRNCGPRVLEKLALDPPAAPAPGATPDPVVTASGAVRLLFSL